MTGILTTLTDFGDLAVLLPLTVVMALWLLAMHSRRGVVAWCVAATLCMGATAILKIYFFVCPPLADLRSPSGHTSLSIMVYGGVALVIAAEGTGPLKLLTIVGGIIVVVAIAISRVLLEAHSIIEVMVGSAIGVAALAIFALEYLRHPPTRVSLRPLILAMALLMIALNGLELRAEEFLHAIGIYLNGVLPACA